MATVVVVLPVAEATWPRSLERMLAASPAACSRPCWF